MEPNEARQILMTDGQRTERAAVAVATLVRAWDEARQRIAYLEEEKRQLVVLCEAIGAKARSGEIPRFWEASAR